MKIKILISMLLIAAVSAACGEGTSVCIDDNPVYCDYLNKYYYNSTDKSCVKKEDTNCEYFALNGDCAICNTGYYFNETSGVCETVVEASVVENCNYYSTAMACIALMTCTAM